MKRISLLVCMLVMMATTVSAASWNDYHWEMAYDFPVTKLLKVINNQNEFDHNIYYYAKGDNKCLVMVCHGFVDDNGKYGVHINDQNRYDYANAISEAISYWISQGKLSNVQYNYVFLNTCFSGYAPKTVRMPNLNMDLVMAIDHKNVTGFAEKCDSSGRVVGIVLYRGYDKSSNALDLAGKTFISNEEASKIQILTE